MCGGDWDGHLRCHAGQRPFMCAECPKKFRNSNQLEIQKKETQSHVCLISVIYVENIMKIPATYITEHKKTFHGKSENLPCEVCGEIFVNRRRLKGHKTRNHTDNTYHQCKVIKFCSKLIEA